MSEAERNNRLRLAHEAAMLFDTRLPYIKGMRLVRNKVTQLLAPTLNLPRTIQTRYGFEMRVTNIEDDIDRNLYFTGTYEAGTLHMLQKLLRPGDTFIDVGANIGLMSVLAATCVGPQGQVYAFEPEPDTFSLLQRNIGLNELTNVVMTNKGLGSQTGAAKIYSNRHDNRGMASFLKNQPEATAVTDVPVITLDAFVEAQQIERVHVIKIDVEGWELAVLQGARGLLSQEDAPILCVEYNTELPDQQQVYDFISAINAYKIFIPAHGNGRVSRLIPVNSAHDLPQRGNPNLFCLLPAQAEYFSVSLT